jgi:hypothetical protein
MSSFVDCEAHRGGAARLVAILAPGSLTPESGSTGGPRRPLYCTVALCLALCGCHSAPSFPTAAPSTGKRSTPAEQNFRPSDIAKSDIDIVAEVHLRESLASTRLLMEKLYRRNPREWHKGGSNSLEGAIEHAFDVSIAFRFPELNFVRGTDAILLALQPEYQGDRVFTFGVGLASMIFIAYNEKTEFYLTDTLDPQKLYNASRNVEIAAWKLANARDAHGELLLLSNQMSGDMRNLSFERELGKIIAYQDAMAQVAAQRSNRTIRRIIQSLATAVFLPL